MWEQVAVLHIAAYWLGYRLARATVAQDNVPLARCISLETGMQVCIAESSMYRAILGSVYLEYSVILFDSGCSIKAATALLKQLACTSSGMASQLMEQEVPGSSRYDAG